MEHSSGEHDPLARALAARLRDAVEAADRMASFAFDAAPGVSSPPALSDGEELATAHDLVLRVLKETGDSLNFRVLTAAAAHGNGASIESLAFDLGLSRIALIERAQALIQVGLVARDLKLDTIRTTPAGEGMLEVVSTLEADVAGWLAKRRRR